MSGTATAWTDATLAAALLAVDPVGLGGVTLRARAGPARERWLDMWTDLAPDFPLLRLPPAIDDTRLLGGLDLTGTLASGRPIYRVGLLFDPVRRSLVVPMAERTSPGLSGRLNAALDAGANFALILLDEGAEQDEQAPASIGDRLAFSCNLDTLALADLDAPFPDPASIVAARAACSGVVVDAGLPRTLTEVALALGIDSLRGPLLALRLARAAAALAGAAHVDASAAEVAVRLVLAPRATRLPAEEVEEPGQAPEPPPTVPDDRSDPNPTSDRRDEIPKEVLLEAARAAIPPDLVAQLMARAAGRDRKAGAGAGNERTSLARGRPAGAMRGLPRNGARIDLIETLRAAAPWQTLRRTPHDEQSRRVLVRSEDFRIRRSRQRAEKVMVFVVDASGSTALARLAEAKGAIEMMLGQTYVARQSVALIAFRGEGAEVLLPPTRSLVATKRRLARLPGGGATPLASGLRAALDLAAQAASRGMQPHLAILTDGRANIGLDGAPGRPAASADAERMARALRAAGRQAIVIDTGNRPSAPARRLAELMGADYLPLPRADARALSGVLRTAIDGKG